MNGQIEIFSRSIINTCYWCWLLLYLLVDFVKHMFEIIRMYFAIWILRYIGFPIEMKNLITISGTIGLW